MKARGQITTGNRVLDAAEALFGQHGFPRASLRQITQKANVNLASVNYHFGSKEDLYQRVVLRHLRPLNEERLSLLAQAEQLAGDQPVPLRAVLDTFIRPLLRRAAADAPGGRSFLRLISRDLVEPPPFMRQAMTEEFAPLIGRYAAVLSQTLPGFPLAELYWRMQFVIGALLHVAAHQHDLAELTQDHCRGDDVDGCIGRLIDFCTAGFGAPTPSGVVRPA
jgi:AcrR family transcriptional regulator